MCIEVTDICFKTDCVQIDVKMNTVLTTHQRENLREFLAESYPNIEAHDCRNSKGPKFGDCIQTTSVPHIFEHVILEECRRFSQPQKVSDIGFKSKPFVGKTTNLGENLAKIELKYYDDIFMLKAINRATHSLNNMLNYCRKTAS